MKKTVKGITVLLCMIMLLTSMLLPVSALSGTPTIQPMWDNTMTVQAEMVFEKRMGYAESAVAGYFDVTCIKTDIYIYFQYTTGWFYITELHDTTYDFVSGVSCQFTAVPGGTYRADYTFTVTRNGRDEVINRTVFNTYSDYLTN